MPMTAKRYIIADNITDISDTTFKVDPRLSGIVFPLRSKLFGYHCTTLSAGCQGEA
jgi:hypothetical protein